MVFTKEQCQKHLDLWLRAEEKVAMGQSYTRGNRTLTRVNLGEIAKNIELWAERLERASGKTGPRIVQFIPRG